MSEKSNPVANLLTAYSSVGIKDIPIEEHFKILIGTCHVQIRKSENSERTYLATLATTVANILATAEEIEATDKDIVEALVHTISVYTMVRSEQLAEVEKALETESSLLTLALKEATVH